jgi:hypothetical protein
VRVRRMVVPRLVSGMVVRTVPRSAAGDGDG